MAWGGVVALAVLALAAAAVASQIPASSRVEVDFGRAWRFHRGDPSQPPQPCTYPTNLTGWACNNTVYLPVHSATDCMRACCSSVYLPNCTTWLYFHQDPAMWRENVTQGCYIASHDAVCAQQHPWTAIHYQGGQRPSPYQPPATFSFAATSFDDASWRSIDCPHDFVIEGDFRNFSDDSNHGYLPRDDPGWYRKHFSLPADWRGLPVTITFDGVFHASRIWLNGNELSGSVISGTGHQNGYTSFSLHLDQVDSVRYGSETNVIALRVDASFGTGHWYEGGGIYRRVRLMRTPPAFIPPSGLFATYNETTQLLEVEVTVKNGYDKDLATPVVVLVQAIDDPKQVLEKGQTQVYLASGQQRTFKLSLNTHLLTLWSWRTPTLYRLAATLTASNDTVSVPIGLRSIKWTADTGFFMNGEHTILRGFSNHNDMGGVGTAVPPRLTLFRIQMVRAVGGNSWRMSHNPGDPLTYDMMDRLGVMVWDENRDYFPTRAADMGQLVQRDRMHPSVIIWSFCNEIECHQASTSVGEAYRSAAKAWDTSRPVSANMNTQSRASVTASLDVQGVSHMSIPDNPSHKYVAWNYSWQWEHHAHPNLPLVSSESSSCRSQRGENNLRQGASFDTSFNGDCLSPWPCMAYRNHGKPYQRPPEGGCDQSWTFLYNPSTGSIHPYLAGHLGIWTFHDYIGEPAGQRPSTQDPWPQASCNFGSFDLAGFAKPAAWHYRAWWLCNATSDSGRPPVAPEGCTEVQIVQEWTPGVGAVAVFSNAPQVELFVNGQSQGRLSMAWANYSQWNVAFAPGNLTAVALSADGNTVLASHTCITPGVPTQLRLSLDAPHPATGTGSALFADGTDAALVRVSLLDAHGNPVSDASSDTNVSFSITSGPGKVIGVANGDPGCHENNKQSWRSTYHGLARAVVQVTTRAAIACETQLLMNQVDVEAAQNGAAGCEAGPVPSIVVRASAPGLPDATLNITVSTDPKDDPFVVAGHSYDIPLTIS